MSISMAAAAAIAGVSSLVSAGVSAYEGNKQEKAANDLLNQEAPEMDIPESQKRALATQGYLAGTDAPGMAAAEAASKNRAAQQYEQGLDVAQSGSQAQGMLSQQGTQLSAEARDREMQNQQWKAQQYQGLVGEQGKMAEAEYAVQHANEVETYNRDQAIGMSMYNSGQQNKMNAIQGLGSTATSMAGFAAMGAFDNPGQAAAKTSMSSIGAPDYGTMPTLAGTPQTMQQGMGQSQPGIGQTSPAMGLGQSGYNYGFANQYPMTTNPQAGMAPGYGGSGGSQWGLNNGMNAYNRVPAYTGK